MKQSRGEFAGMRSVFSFTLSQMLKGPANVAGLVIMLIIALAAPPVLTLILGGENETKYDSVETIYYLNETGYDINFEELRTNTFFSDNEIREADFPIETYMDEVGEHDVIIHIYYNKETQSNYVEVLCIDPELIFAEASLIESEACRLLDEARYLSLGVDSEQLDVLMSPYNVTAETAQDYYGASEVSEGAVYLVQYVYSIIVIMLSMFSVTFIMRAMVEEKASKLVETLLVSVKPLALIMGKIMAAMVYVVVLFSVMGLGFFVSYRVTGLVLDTSVIAGMMGSAGMASMNFDASTVVIVAISLIIAYFIFAILSGIFGSGCSNMEDLEAANMSVVIIILAGYLVSVILAASESTAVVTSLIPFVSIFSAPAQYICGNISFALLCLAWALQVLEICFMAWFGARIYKELVMYRGEKLKFMQLISFARKRKITE